MDYLKTNAFSLKKYSNSLIETKSLEMLSMNTFKN